MPQTPVDWLREYASNEEIADLNSVDVDLSPGRHVGIADTILAWREHVAKFVSDLTATPDDRSTWGAHNFVAALVIRDCVADGSSQLGPELKTLAETIVSEVDRRYLDFTEPDHDGCTDRIDGRKDPNRSWWWRRIPRAGPVREEVGLYYGHAT